MGDRRKLINRREADKEIYDVESFQRIYKVWDHDSMQDIPYPWPPRPAGDNWPRYAERLQSHCAGFDLLVTKRDEQIKELKRENTILANDRDDLDKQLDRIRDVTRGL